MSSNAERPATVAAALLRWSHRYPGWPVRPAEAISDVLVIRAPDGRWCFTRDGRTLYGPQLRPDSDCRDITGRILRPGQHVTVLVTVRGHAGSGTVQGLLPGQAGEVASCGVIDTAGRRAIINCSLLSIDPPARCPACSCVAADNADNCATCRAERDRLMPQACGGCGAEAPADGVEPAHLNTCPAPLLLTAQPATGGTYNYTVTWPQPTGDLAWDVGPRGNLRAWSDLHDGWWLAHPPGHEASGWTLTFTEGDDNSDGTTDPGWTFELASAAACQQLAGRAETDACDPGCLDGLEPEGPGCRFCQLPTEGLFHLGGVFPAGENNVVCGDCWDPRLA
jgi:hypothetical protein